MPFHAQVDKEIGKLLNFVGAIVYPVCLALCIPVFIHHLVMEKEEKLVENMKINGMKMHNYWLVNGLVNFTSYALTAFCFVIFGRYVCDLDFFYKTHPRILFEVYFLWGLSQISLPMFFSVFFSSAQAAAMTSYAITVWTCCVTADLNVSVF